MVGSLGRGGQARNPASRLVSFFSLDGGSQWEDTSLYHSPGLRDGVPAQGTRVRSLPSHNLWSRLAKARVFLAGNKLGRSQVFRIVWDCAYVLPGRDPGKTQR
jgi:hypothetical protein